MVNRPSESGSRRPRGVRVAADVLDRQGRRERADEIEELAARGFRSDEIAEKLGLARSTVNKYRRDPDGERERARRERYRGRCLGCERPTDGSHGPGRAPRWCPDCAPVQRRRWSDEWLLEAIRAWTRLTGRPPSFYDWSPAHAPRGHPGAARYLAEQGQWPNASSVASQPHSGRYVAGRRAEVTPTARRGAGRALRG